MHLLNSHSPTRHQIGGDVIKDSKSWSRVDSNVKQNTTLHFAIGQNNRYCRTVHVSGLHSRLYNVL